MNKLVPVGDGGQEAAFDEWTNETQLPEKWIRVHHLCECGCLPDWNVASVIYSKQMKQGVGHGDCVSPSQTRSISGILHSEILFGTFSFSVWDLSSVSRACACSRPQIHVDLHNFFPPSVFKGWEEGGQRGVTLKPHLRLNLLWLLYINHSQKVQRKHFSWEFGGLDWRKWDELCY